MPESMLSDNTYETEKENQLNNLFAKLFDFTISFLKLLDISPDLLASNELYYHIHPKLIDPSLKAKYTVSRKKAGYMDENHLL